MGSEGVRMKRLKALFMTCVCLSFLLLSSMPVEASTMNRTEIAAFLDQKMNEKMEKYNIPNAVVSFVADGEVWVNKGYGYADLQTKKPVDAERTLFRIGSTSKLLTWTAIMQLVEQGKLDLNTDINQYLDFEIPDRLYHDQSEQEAVPITLTHLMTHTPGFEDSLDTVYIISEVPFDSRCRKKLPLIWRRPIDFLMANTWRGHSSSCQSQLAV